jgi:hypothetical protein
MKCPHCAIAFRAEPRETAISSYPKRDDQSVTYGFKIRSMICPECHRMAIFLVHGYWQPQQGNSAATVHENVYEGFERMVYPPSSVRVCPADVPINLKQDFEEACTVLSFSPKASAALSRRCLQQVLVEHQGAQGRDLQKQIEDFIATKHPPAYISDHLHAVRQIGNYAAHPQKDMSTGELLPVATGEAEWNLEVLESLFDFVFVQPSLAKKRKDAFNKKLEAAKKPRLS